MFCPDCGTWNRASAARCTRCDEALPEIPGSPTEKPDAELTQLRANTGGRYRVHRRLGSGGMAHVYYAEHSMLERPVVLKVLHSHLARDEEMRERFRREAEAACRLSHPHICSMLDYGDVDGSVFLVMPYFGGGSLADMIGRERTMSGPEAASVGAQVACALDYAHRRGVVHRDVKPDNIVLVPAQDDEGHPVEIVKVCDFGIAALATTPNDEGVAVGTPEYMAPEQTTGLAVKPSADVYGCGVVLYEMLAGEVPFSADQAYRILMKHRSEAPVPPTLLEPGISAELEKVVLKCLEKAPERRFQSARELRVELRKLADMKA